MTRRNESIRLRHMFDSARDACEFSQGRTRADLDSDRLFAWAMTHLVEVIGEAASHLSEETRRQHPEIPWSQIVGTRNRLIHGYDQIDFDILWDVLHLDLPPLVEQLKKIVDEDSGA